MKNLIPQLTEVCRAEENEVAFDIAAKVIRKVGFVPLKKSGF